MEVAASIRFGTALGDSLREKETKLELNGTMGSMVYINDENDEIKLLN